MRNRHRTADIRIARNVRIRDSGTIYTPLQRRDDGFLVCLSPMELVEMTGHTSLQGYRVHARVVMLHTDERRCFGMRGRINERRLGFLDGEAQTGIRVPSANNRGMGFLEWFWI